MQKQIRQAVAQAARIILGKDQQLKLAVACLLARGHLLIEDLPGMGKTTLAQTLSRVFGLEYRRIQFTSDMLPGDIVGTSVFDANSGEFHIKKGPVFSQVLLADEINRATPKAQSALLEAMEERQVTLDGVTQALPAPFFVIATQNPVTQTGTFPLPESQLDRFLMRLGMGYPSPEAERALLMGHDRRELVEAIKPLVSQDELQAAFQQVQQVRTSEDLVDYVQRLLEFSRRCGLFVAGLSPRAGLGLLRVSRAHAWLEGRDYVIPEDVQTVFLPVCEHRLLVGTGEDSRGAVQQILEAVPVVRQAS